MAEPRVAIVIPAFKQPSLVIEAIESALRQRTTFDFRVVVVNDGCPFAQTDDICRAYARAHGDQFRYVHRKNGGLSAARNSGIDAALAMWPSVEAIQLLDSDDRLGPSSLQNAFDALQRNPDAAWAYPNCRRVGFSRDFTNVAGPWNVLELMVRNYVFCASMVRRSVFESGQRYDEQMRLGYEDWNFWIDNAEAGLRGVHVPEVDFQYRQRAESMLADTNREDASVTGYVRRIHPSLYNPARVLELEHAEMPRFAIVLADENRVALTSDPARLERTIPLEELSTALLRGIIQPQRDRFPTFVAVTTRGVLEAAREARFDAGLFWTMQTAIEREPHKFAAARIRSFPSRDYSLNLAIEPTCTTSSVSNAAIVMLTRDVLHQCLLEEGRRTDRAKATGLAARDVQVFDYRLTHPRAGVAPCVDAVAALQSIMAKFAPDYRRKPTPSLARGSIPYRLTGDSTPLVRSIFKCGPLHPALLDHSRLHVGYVIPVCEFGGAERVTLNFARETRNRGWSPHLFVIGTATATMLPEFADVFDSVTVIPPPVTTKPEDVLGLLANMNVVVNNNCGAIDPLLAPLRRLGIKTFSQIHSVTIPHVGMPTGQPYEVLRYEHCLDGVLVVSKKLARWCRAWGMPECKIFHVPNGASFAVSDAQVETTLIERSERSILQPLNVLFLGRFDREKGMDRLVALCAETQRQALPVTWRVVGRRVLGSDGHAAVDLGPIQSLIEPAVMTATELSRLYRWADVVVMCSRFEGVPLTILEAQRFGCVALSTSVGAIDELIENDRTGYLFSNKLEGPELAAQMSACLGELAADRGKLMRIARAAAAVRRDATWAQAFEPFARAVEAMLPGKTKAGT